MPVAGHGVRNCNAQSRMGLCFSFSGNRCFQRQVSGPIGTDSRAQGLYVGSIGLAERTLGSRNPTA
jgi:hypothetical protein